MSHVDEGLLHAWLDGALEGTDEHADVERHLETCADCRARLEDARALRQRAAGLLEGAPAGAITTPPFAEVLARRGPRRKRPAVFRMNRLVGLGWAATIALAVGVGWLARGSLPIGGLPERTAAPAEMTAAPAPDRQALPETAVATEREAIGGIDADQSGAARESREEAQALPAAPLPATEPTAVADLAAAPVTDAPQAAGKAGRAEPDRADEGAGVVQMAAEAPAPPRLQAEAAARGRTAVNEATARDMVEGGTWMESDDESAAAYLATPLLAVPGLDLLRVETGTVLGEPAVRVTQRLGGDSLVIVQYRTPGADAVPGFAEGVDAAGSGYPVALRRFGVTALFRGPVSADSLRRLAARIP